jgi:hypothetical protein
MAKKMPRSRSVSMPTPKPSSAPMSAAAAICSASGACIQRKSSTAVYAPMPKNAGVPKFTYPAYPPRMFHAVASTTYVSTT